MKAISGLRELARDLREHGGRYWGLLPVIPRVQRIRMGAGRAGQRAHVWADELSVHVLIDGELVKTVPSSLTAENLAELRMRGASPAGPPPATPSLPKMASLPGGTVIEADRTVDANGNADLGGRKIPAGRALAGQRVTFRLDGHLIHVVHDGHLARTLPCPIPAGARGKLRGARLAATALQSPLSGRHHGHAPKTPRRNQVRRQDRHRPRRGHPLSHHLRRHRNSPVSPERTTTGHPLESQNPRPENLTDVKHHPRPSTMS